jgi:uncharacterized protein DUF4085
MHFFKRKLLYPPNNKKPDTNVKDLHNAYREHLRSIKSRLPEGAWKLASHSFHDARVVSVARPAKRQLIIILDGAYWGCGYDFINEQLLGGRFTRLHFSGVKKDWAPDTIVGDDWLNEEMGLSEIAQFDYQVLLWKDEIRIQADDVHIEANDNLTLLT